MYIGEGSYRYAENLRVVTDKDGNTGELHLIEGTNIVSEVHGPGVQLLGFTSIRNYIVEIVKRRSTWAICRRTVEKDEQTEEYKVGEMEVVAGPFTKPIWPTKEEMPKVIETNLRLVDGNLVPVDVKDWPANELVNGIPQGALPSNTEVVYNNEEESLTYHNYSGTPVNWDYDIYIPVTYGYKWKTQVNWVKVHVSSNTGTNDTTKN